jgi:hypothetical protein
MSADLLHDDQWPLLEAVIDRIMPVDEHPSATGFGAEAYIADRRRSADSPHGSS